MEELYKLTYYTKSKIVKINCKYNEFSVFIMYDVVKDSSNDSTDNSADNQTFISPVMKRKGGIVTEYSTSLPTSFSVPYLFADMIYIACSSTLSNTVSNTVSSIDTCNTYYIVKQDGSTD